MSVRKQAGTRGTTWHVLLAGRDPVTGKRLQQRLSRDPATGQPMLTKTRAKEVEREALVHRHRGGTLDPDCTSLAEYLERWLRDTADTRTGSTQYSWTIIVRTRITPRLGEVPLARLTPMHLDGFYRDLAKTYAPSTIATTRAVMSAALKCAVRWRLLPHNPHEGVRLPRTASNPKRPIWTGR